MKTALVILHKEILECAARWDLATKIIDSTKRQHNDPHSLGHRCASSLYGAERAPSATSTRTAL